MPTPRNRRPGQDKGSLLSAREIAVTGRLTATSLTVRSGEKLLITGPNGCGKSTLLAVLAGDLTPTRGTVHTSARVGLLTQMSGLEAELDSVTVEQAYRTLVGADLAEQVPLAQHGLIAPRDHHREVGMLSVGQRRRLELAAVLADPPDVLLLDEPTNHLSLMLVTQLEAAITTYPGAVVVASHDRWLRREWSGQVHRLAPDRSGHD